MLDVHYKYKQIPMVSLEIYVVAYPPLKKKKPSFKQQNNLFDVNLH